MIPRWFSLKQNSPNPFNPSTVITYSIPEDRGRRVKLEVFNLKGQTVRTLVDELKEGGTYGVYWDGTDSGGVQEFPQECISIACRPGIIPRGEKNDPPALKKSGELFLLQNFTLLKLCGDTLSGGRTPPRN